MLDLMLNKYSMCVHEVVLSTTVYKCDKICNSSRVFVVLPADHYICNPAAWLPMLTVFGSTE